MVDELETGIDFEKFTWRIEDFSKKNAMKLRSKTFKIRGCSWRILVYPLRKDVNHFSLYLMVADSLPPYGWSRNTFFKLVLINQVDKKKSVIKETQQKFKGGYRSWGSFFLNLNDLYDHKKGYLVRDTCIIEAHICVSDFPPKIIHQDINYPLNPNSSTPTPDSRLGDQATDQSSDERDTISPRTSGSSPREGEIQGSDLTLRELIDLESLRPEEEAFIPLLEEVKDISEEDCKNVQSLWEELVKSSGFDLTWLEPYVQSALDVKAHLERAQRLKKLKDNVVALEIKMKKLRGELAAAEAEFEVARKGLSQVRKGFQEMNVNAPIGYAMF
ncbi:TRAF-like [Sesbania bispinosa]|nr:TRAF-like [Sesbania bispinosa]